MHYDPRELQYIRYSSSVRQYPHASAIGAKPAEMTMLWTRLLLRRVQRLIQRAAPSVKIAEPATCRARPQHGRELILQGKISRVLRCLRQSLQLPLDLTGGDRIPDSIAVQRGSYFDVFRLAPPQNAAVFNLAHLPPQRDRLIDNSCPGLVLDRTPICRHGRHPMALGGRPGVLITSRLSPRRCSVRQMKALSDVSSRTAG
jgi:hypothetical protein